MYQILVNFRIPIVIFDRFSSSIYLPWEVVVLLSVDGLPETAAVLDD